MKKFITLFFVVFCANIIWAAKESIIIEPLIHGGKSTTIYRSGSPALPLIVSLMKALKLVIPDVMDNYEYVSKLLELSLDYGLNVNHQNVDGDTLIHFLLNIDSFVSRGGSFIISLSNFSKEEL